MGKKQTGFTIVELLIVVVVIAILAAITIVSYNGITVRANDALRKQNLADLSKVLNVYYIDKGNWIDTGVSTGNGQGWVSSGPSSVAAQLQAAGYLPAGNALKDPNCIGSETTGCSGYLKMTCGTGETAKTYLMARLQSEGSVSMPTEFNDASCTYRNWWNSFNMNYYVRVN